MNYQDLRDAKKLFDAIVGLCDTIDEKDLWERPDGFEVSLSDILRRDIANFIMYLSASDGTISYEELQIYKIITGFGGDTIQSLRDHIKEANIYSADFESTPPLIMKILCVAEKNALMWGVDLGQSLLNHMVTLYEIIGKVVISIDGGITYGEKRDFNIFMHTILEYAADQDPWK